MSEWMSVDNHIPYLSDRCVLVHFENGSIETVHVDDHFRDITNGCDEAGNTLYTKWYLSSGITHWMELPDKPLI